MRLSRLLCLPLLFSAICFAQDVVQNQDTNFSAGPQYLVTSGSPLFLRSIATPSLSLAPVPAETSSGAYAAAEPSAQALTAPLAPQFPNLLTIYYKGPSASLAALTEAAGEGEVSERGASEIEISSTPASLSLSLPASITNVGVTEMLDPQSLRSRGYGLQPGETAAFWKTHKTPAQRVFTNADVERLHGS
jgi:hypothetical protein